MNSSLAIATVRAWVQRAVPTSRHTQLGLLALTGLCVIVCTIAYVFSPPRAFPTQAIISIPADSTAPEFAHVLYTAGVIRSETMFRILARVSLFDTHLVSGSYVFREPLNLSAVVGRIGRGQHGIDPVRITLTEGMTTHDIATLLDAQLPGFNEAQFLSDASTSEGYLFPDTYYFMPGDTPNGIVIRLRTRFSNQIASITPEILASGRSFSDIVIMASILEREARTPEDMRMVAGILWNRIDAKYPLQVDATFGYMHGKNGYTPTATDLGTESPYNTYIHKGFPPTPISNPGLAALSAAASPTPTNYFYYLTGKDGLMHYAKTFEEHKKNRAQYLD